MTDRSLSPRLLNRATLDRQLLLRRQPMPALRAVAHLAGTTPPRGEWHINAF